MNDDELDFVLVYPWLLMHDDPSLEFYTLRWSFINASEELDFKHIDTAARYPKSMFKKILEVSTGIWQVKATYLPTVWIGVGTVPDQVPSPKPFDHKFPSGGAFGGVYASIHNFGAFLLAVDPSLPINVAFRRVIIYVGISGHPLAEAATQLRQGDKMSAADTIFSYDIEEDEILRESLENSRPTGLPGVDEVNSNDQQWWQLGQADERVWHYKILYSLVDAAVVTGH